MQATGALHDRVRALLAEHFGVRCEEIADGASLTGDLGADSLDIAALVLEAEDAFDIDIADRDVAGITLVGHLLRLVEVAMMEKDMGSASSSQTTVPTSVTEERGSASRQQGSAVV
jgi:acyl carrier protein